MALKFDLSAWVTALEAYDAQDFTKALDLFEAIASSSKIRTNMGLIYATIGEHNLAISQFKLATGMDEYLSVAYFQTGVSYFLLGNYELALPAFDDAYTHLRGNKSIDYHQLGLAFELYAAEILFNKGLCKLNLGQVAAGFADLESAQKEKVTEAHGVIDEAIRDAGEGYTVFSIPVGVVYRPCEKKVKNSKIRDYLGKVKLIGSRESTGPDAIAVAAPPSPEKPDADVSYPRTRSATPSPLPDPETKNAELLRSVSTPVRRGSTRTSAAARYANLRRNNTYQGESTPPVVPLDRLRPIRTAAATMGGRNAELGSAQVPVPMSAREVISMRRRGTLIQAPASAPVQGGEGMKKGMARRPTVNGRTQRLEKEEDASSATSSSDGASPSIRIMVKLHYQGDVRGMAVYPNTPFTEFMSTVTRKFSKTIDGLALKFTDEDGVLVTLRDEMDYDLAIETAKEVSRGRLNGRLAVWCTDA